MTAAGTVEATAEPWGDPVANGSGGPNSGELNELGDLLAGLHRLIRRTLRKGVSGPWLRGAQVELLRLVSENPGIGVSAAARELHLAGNSVSTLVRQLVEAGLLRRETAAADRRAAVLMPTAEAEARLRLWRSRREALICQHTAQLDEGERAALAAAIPALRKLAAGLRETEGR